MEKETRRMEKEKRRMEKEERAGESSQCENFEILSQRGKSSLNQE